MPTGFRAACVSLLGLLVADAAPTPTLADAIAACGRYQYRQAVEWLDALDVSALTPEALRYRGIALGKLGRWEDAVASLERAVATAPRDVGILVDLANAHGQYALAAGPLGKISGARKARASYERAVELAPGSLDAQTGLFLFYLAAPGIVGGSREKATQHLAAIEALDALSGQLARVELAAADKDFNRAFALLRELQRKHPEDFRPFYVFGRIAATSGREPAEGLASLERCRTLSPPLRTPGLPGVYLRTGDILRQRGDRAAARATYEESLRIFPEYPSAREALAKL